MKCSIQNCLSRARAHHFGGMGDAMPVFSPYCPRHYQETGRTWKFCAQESCTAWAERSFCLAHGGADYTPSIFSELPTRQVGLSKLVVKVVATMTAGDLNCDQLACGHHYFYRYPRTKTRTCYQCTYQFHQTLHMLDKEGV